LSQTISSAATNPRRHVAPHDLRGLLRELRQEGGRPRSVAELFGDLPALAVMLMLGDRLAFERLAVDVRRLNGGKR